MKKMLACSVFLLCLLAAVAQADPEFPKGWVLYLESQLGTTTHFNTSPDLFLTSLRLSPQATVVPGLLRIGATASVVFNNKKADGVFGPSLACKLGSVNIQQLGSLLNVQVQAENVWGTGKQKLVGGLLHIELAQLLLIGISVHRDYGLNNWWFQGGIGYNLLRKKNTGPQDPIQ